MRRVASSLRFGLFLSICIAVSGAWTRAAAQDPAVDPNAWTASGTITAVHAPDSFEVKGKRVGIVATTRFESLGGSPKEPAELRAEIAVGAYVEAVGAMDWATHTIVAKIVRVRDVMGDNVSGAGVIDRVIVTGSEPVFRADGYRFRVDSSTEVDLGNGLASLSDVGTATWVRLEGRRNDLGEVLATKASFAKPKLPKHKHDPMAVQETVFPPGSMIDFDSYFKTERAMHKVEDAGGWCGWYPVPENDKLQEGVRRIGMSVVPQYQRDLPDDDPGKIPFRFYAVDEKEIRSEIFCDKGLVLVPFEAMQRLKNDDQVAALLADGVAAELQRQRARLMLDMGLINAAEAAVYLTVRSAAGAGAAWAGGLIVNHQIQRRMEDERGRVALGLMADAGFDPWQAPEAWRLLEPRRLPRDQSKLKYPARSIYLLSILDLQYKRAATSSSTAASAADAAAASPRAN